MDTNSNNFIMLQPHVNSGFLGPDDFLKKWALVDIGTLV